MKICIFFHRFDGGGAERTTITLANELHKRGYQLTVAVRYAKGPSRRLLDPDIPVYDMKLPERGKLVKNIRNIRSLVYLMNKGDFDFIMAVMSEMAEVAAAAYSLSAKRTPLICVLHNTISVEKTSFQAVRHRLFRYFDRQYSRVVAVSEAVREDYIHSCCTDPRKVVTIYNPVVNTKLFEMAEKQPDHPWLNGRRDFKVLLLAGRLTAQKNHALMFRTLKKLRDEGDYRLILLGEGELREELEQTADELGISRWIDFAGYTDNPYSFMRACDCLVLSSRYEGLPTVLIEAMACGTRIVSVDCPSGPREILDHGKYGILVGMDDEEDLKNGILHALHTEPDRKALRERSMEFSVEKSSEKYEQVFHETLMSTNS